jgi:hypothetical protein
VFGLADLELTLDWKQLASIDSETTQPFVWTLCSSAGTAVIVDRTVAASAVKRR